LHAWLAGYAGAGGGGSGQRPLSVFLVGDPKQSIYRFRRADPRVFGEARAFLQEAMGGAHLSCDHTRRNALAVIDALNAVFTKAQADAEFDGFRPHTTASRHTGLAYCLPVVPRPDKALKAPGPSGWRDSLTTPRVQTEEALRLVEARHVADEIARCLAGTDGQPPCLPGEVMVLARKRASLAHVAQALQERGIPCNAPSERELATLPEVRDMIALLDALVSPNHDLSLAHALRSPVFGAADEDLQALALAAREARQHPAPGDAVESVSWWAVLLAGAGPGRPALDRARALLPGWADAARSLPPHDLLDRVVAEGDLYARTAAAVPAALRGLALATLDALLGQALDLDGGRYATPYRFVRALKRRPLSLPAGAAAQAVQLLTIHGAKGLEAEAVFLVDGRPAPPRAETATLLIDWPADAPQPLCCAFVASETRCPPSLRGLHAQERAGRAREELNGLYVAMTRAKRRLVVSANEPHVAATLNGPWDRLTAAGVEVRAPHQTDAGLLLALSEADAPIQLATLPSLATRPEPGSASRPAAAPGEPDSGGDTEVHRLGRAVHRVLEWQPAPEELEAACLSACSSLGLVAEQAPVVRSVVASILGSPACRPFFDPQQYDEAANELPLAWQGESLRLDRLVRRRHAEGYVEWWVLDYKMQFLPQGEAANVAQLKRYCDAVRALQPGERVRGGLIGGDGSLWVLPDPEGTVPR
jgi:ATP-dependent helicase/nuclease subunit A